MTNVKRKTARDEKFKEEVTRDTLGLDTDDDVTFAGVTASTNGLTADAGGLTVTAGGATITAGGLTVSADGATITGDTTINGALDGVEGFTLESLRLTDTTELTLASTGHALQVGASSGANLAADPNEVQARNNGSAAGLGLNPHGGAVTVNGSTEGSLQVGPSGIAIKQILHGSGTLNLTPNAQTSSNKTFTVSGAAAGDPVFVGYSNVVDGITFDAWVSAANTVRVQAGNYTSGSVGTGNVDVEIIVFKL